MTLAAADTNDSSSIPWRLFMKTVLLIAMTMLFANSAAFAASSSCETRAADKKLAGAAKTSFIKKCEKDAADAAEAANKSCSAMATEKKLAGAAKSSFVTKCVKDATEAK